MAIDLKGNLMTTGIGSLPLRDPEEAARLVLDAGLSVPFWPQLPARSFCEQMIPQYTEGLPCVRVDPEAGRVVAITEHKYDELERFFQAYLDEDPSAFAISEDFAAGLYAFERLASETTWPLVKGQVTGPITLATGISDAEKRPLYADVELRDAAAKLLARKAQWQIARLRRFAADGVVIFVDEPVLAAYGSSAYLNVTEENVQELEGEVFEAIAEAGGISGMHVCGNSDWGVMARTGVQVLNFDAYQYGSTVALYPEEVGALFDRGGCIAWGIVPTSQAVREETADALARRLDECLGALAAKGFADDLLRERSLLTPSCGTGSLDTEDARRVFELLDALHRKLTG